MIKPAINRAISKASVWRVSSTVKQIHLKNIYDPAQSWLPFDSHVFIFRVENQKDTENRVVGPPISRRMLKRARNKRPEFKITIPVIKFSDQLCLPFVENRRILDDEWKRIRAAGYSGIIRDHHGGDATCFPISGQNTEGWLHLNCTGRYYLNESYRNNKAFFFACFERVEDITLALIAGVITKPKS